jgi:hypothetical protein
MVLVKIDRRTIKENPNAGRTDYHISGPTEITVTYNGEMPEKWSKLFMVTEKSIDSGQIVTVWTGVGLVTPNDIKKLQRDNNTINVNTRRDYQTVYSRTPEPDYLYKYTNPFITCSRCLKYVRFKSIIQEYIEDLGHFDECPYCHENNTFDYQLEKIEDAIKETA